MPLTKVQSTGITDSAVTTAKVNADAVTEAKIVDDAISEEHLDVTAITGHPEKTSIVDADKFLISDSAASGALKYIQNSNLSGFDVTSITGATELAAIPADTDEFVISDAGVLKRVDYSFVKSTSEPLFMANTSDTTSYSDATTTQVEFNSEVFDVGGCYNNTGSTVTLNGVSAPAYSFAPNVAGKYYFSTTMQCYSSSGQLGNALVMLFKNGSQFAGASMNHSGSGPFVESISAEGIVDLNGTSDYVLAKVYIDVGSGTPQLLGGGSRNLFMGYKLS